MPRKIGYVTLLVGDYDEAIDYYTRVLGFELVEDVVVSEAKRWVVVSPAGSSGTSLVLAKAASPDQMACIGNQTGGRVFLFLHTDDFWGDYEAMTSKGVVFKEAPRCEAYGIVAVFEDFYGNAWDLLQLGN